MSELADFDIDRTTAQAWRSFQSRLADHLADMGADDILVIEAEVAQGDDEAGSPPYVQFAGYAVVASSGVADQAVEADEVDQVDQVGEGDAVAMTDGADWADGGAMSGRAGDADGSSDAVPMLRGEVSGNANLAEQCELDDHGVRDLLGLGWRAPTTTRVDPDGRTDGGAGNFSVEVPRSQADRLAVMAVGALRDVFAVAHPAFLDIEGMAPEEAQQHVPARSVTDEADWPEDIERAVMPSGSDHLRELVDEALTPLFGEAPQHDEDGDIPVPWGSSLVFVHVNESAPVIELASTVVRGVLDRERAAFEVGVLNRDQRYLTFILVGDCVGARLNLPACPFVPEHLRFMLTGMSFQLDEIGEDLVARVGGRLALDPDRPETTASDAEPARHRDRDESDETALLTLLQLDADGTGSVDAELAAGVCGFDQGRIVRLLGQTDAQEAAWRGSRDEAVRLGDQAEARTCEQELEAWQRTTRVLRRGLRLVVERSLGREGAAGSSYPPATEGRRAQPPRRTRRRPDGDGR